VLGQRIDAKAPALLASVQRRHARALGVARVHKGVQALHGGDFRTGK
jgi:hypothetical protein